MPIRQPKGSVAPASSPPTRIGVPLSQLGLDPALGEAHVAALALAGLAADHRLEALHVEQLGIAVPLPALAHRVEHLGRAREEGVALAPVGAEPVEVGRGRSGPPRR